MPAVAHDALQEPRYPSTSDPFVLDINILSNQSVVRARLTLDTGSPANLISKEVWESLDLPPDSAGTLEADENLLGTITGTVIQPIGKVKLTWWIANMKHTQTTDFLIVLSENTFVGVVLGAYSITELRILVRSPPVGSEATASKCSIT